MRSRAIRAEVEFPRDWVTHVVERPWGVLYHTPEIPDSHDGNHAHIVSTDDPAAALREVTDCYTARGVTPRIYHFSEPGEPISAALRAAATAQGFVFYGTDAARNPTRYFVHEGPAAEPPPCPSGLEIRRVEAPSPALAEMIESSDGPRSRKVVERRLAGPAYHLLGAFRGNTPVGIASLQQLASLVRVDDVLTSPAHRGMGIGRTLIQHMVAYHARRLTGPIWLYAENPIAIRAYLSAGFVEVLPKFDFWSAWRE
jgi:GNAT superfamily N-acetyltransferase